jgi:type I restriction enzyme, S subunit
MNNETMMLLDKHFDAAFAAPDGIKKLRELILTLAMQGKLVPQDPNDEPASELLKSIKLAKNKLVEEGKFKSLDSEPSNKIENAIFPVPKGWVWCYLDDIAAIARGGSPRPIKSYLTDDPNGLNWIKIGDSDRGKIFISNTREKIRPEGLKSTRMVFPGDLILSNSMSFGYPYIMNIEGCIHDGWLIIRTPEQLIDKLFVYYLFLSGYAKKAFREAASGAVVQNLNADKVRQLLVPLPPLEEQHRIVAEIDRLMARCDELEKLRVDRSLKLLTVHTAALDNLLNAKESSDFSTAWHFITQNFSELYSVKENVAELRKAILQLAVMGKLVPQESAPQIASLQSILAESSINGVSKGPTSDTSATEVLRISAGTSQKDFYVNENDFKHVDLSANEIQKFKLISGDLLACRFNGNLHYVGRFSYYRGESGRVQVNPDKLIRFRIKTELHYPRYVCYMMNAAQTRDAIEAMCATTAGNIGLSAGRLKTIEIPLPPLAEQRRIVAKIDRLMGMCDRLEESIEAAKGKQTDLLNALMSQV